MRWGKMSEEAERIEKAVREWGKPRYITIKCRICGELFDDDEKYWKHHMLSHAWLMPQYIKREYL
jgi:uncharacterized C2H2 Zn-finger protein